MTNFNPKKILILTTRPFLPAYGGDKVRVKGFFNYFLIQKNVKITIICTYLNKKDFESFKTYLPSNVEVHGVKIRLSFAILRSIKGFFSKSRISQVEFFNNSSFKSKINELGELNDLIYAHLIRSAFYIQKKHLRNKTVFDSTDSLALSYSRISKINSVKQYVFKKEMDKIFIYEKNANLIFKNVIFISSQDIFYLHKSKPKNVQLVKNGVNLNSKINLSGLKKDILFVGNFNSAPNIEALIFFLVSIAPYIDFEWSLIIAGSNLHRIKKYTKQYKNIMLIENYSSLNNISSDLLCGIAPMQSGAGIQNKILDYLSIGLPCISSKIAFLPFMDSKRNPILMANKTEEYIYHLNSLKFKEHYFNSISDKSYTYIRDQFTWEKCFEAGEVDKIFF